MNDFWGGVLASAIVGIIVCSVLFALFKLVVVLFRLKIGASIWVWMTICVIIIVAIWLATREEYQG